MPGCTSCTHYTQPRMVPSCRKQQPWHPKSCNCLWHSHNLGQNPIPSVELLGAQGPCGPSVPQPQGICRKSGSNLSLAQSWQEVTATNELNDWINLPSPLDRCAGPSCSVTTELQHILPWSNLSQGIEAAASPNSCTRNGRLEGRGRAGIWAIYRLD